MRKGWKGRTSSRLLIASSFMAVSPGHQPRPVAGRPAARSSMCTPGQYPVRPRGAAHALVLTGVRGCGKSTLQGQIRRGRKGRAVMLNLEDTRLYRASRHCQPPFPAVSAADDDAGAPPDRPARPAAVASGARQRPLPTIRRPHRPDGGVSPGCLADAGGAAVQRVVQTPRDSAAEVLRCGYRSRRGKQPQRHARPRPQTGERRPARGATPGSRRRSARRCPRMTRVARHHARSGGRAAGRRALDPRHPGLEMAGLTSKHVSPWPASACRRRRLWIRGHRARVPP